MKPEILIVDDHQHTLELLEMTLVPNGWSVSTARSGGAALEKIKHNKPDLVLLDVMLDDTTGLKLTSRIKNNPNTADIPVILLTARDSESDMVLGLSAGADDYITKPFSSAVLLARIEALLRRADRPDKSVSRIVNIQNLSVVSAAGQAYLDNTALELTPSEFAILMALIEAAPQPCSRKELLEKISPGSGRGERIVDVHIASLRKKLNKSRHLIKTVHGRGYRMKIAPSKVSS